MGQAKRVKFFAKKRTKSGKLITIAEGKTRQELINKIKSDSNTYKKEREDNVKEAHRYDLI